MPIYQYAYNECGHQAEYLVKRIGEHQISCEQCHGNLLSRFWHNQGFSNSSRNEFQRFGDANVCIAPESQREERRALPKGVKYIGFIFAIPFLLPSGKEE